MRGGSHDASPLQGNVQRERRLLERLAAEEQVSVRLIDAPTADLAIQRYACITLDISPGGMCLYADQSFDVGEQVEVTIQPTLFSRKHTLRGMIRWRDKADSSGYLYGVEFINRHALGAWCREFH